MNRASSRSALDRFNEDLENGAPGSRQVLQVIAAAAKDHETAVRVALGKRDQPPRSVGVRSRREPQIGKRIAREPVRAALEDQELGARLVDEALGLLPCAHELRIARAGRERQVQLGALGRAAPGLVHRAGPRIEKLTVLVDVHANDVGVVLELVEDAVAMVHIDVDIGDAAHPVLRAQGLDEHARIVEYAEACGALAPRVVQSPDRLEAAPRLARHDAARPPERRSDARPRDLVASGESRRVTVVQVSAAAARRLHDAIDVFHGMESLDYLPGCQPALCKRYLVVQTQTARSAPERALPVDRQRMALGKAVAAELAANEEMRRHARPARGSRSTWRRRRGR